MPRLLVVQPDQTQADTLRNALRAHIPDEIVIAQSVEDALASIDRQLPDVVLLPSLMSWVVEGYLIRYLSPPPGAGPTPGSPRAEPLAAAAGAAAVACRGSARPAAASW